MNTSRFLLVVLLSFLACSGAGKVAVAGLDPELNKPYDLQIVLHVSKHRQLTDFFQDRLESTLGDRLQAAFGEMVRVKVVRNHPLLDDVLKRGLERGLDKVPEKEKGKVHFVFIDYVANQYEIRGRQYDGLTGQVSPVVRLTRTRDRDFVAAAAARMVAQDFGMVGTLQLPANNKEVRVDLKASALGSMAPWIKIGEVFQLVQVSPGNEPNRAIRYNLLQVTRAPGEGGQTCTCQLFRPVDAPLDAVGILGYRCIKLNTGTYPLRLRLLETKGKSVALLDDNSLPVTVRHRGFVGEKDTLLDARVKEGVLDTTARGVKGQFEHVAFVTIEQLGNGRQANVPVAMMADKEEEIIVSRTPNKDTDRMAFSLERWFDGVRVTLLVENNLFAEIKQLVEKKDRFEALEQTRKGLDNIRKDITELKAQRTQLQPEIDKLTVQQRPRRLATYDEQMRKIEDGEKNLTEFLAALETRQKEENDPERRKLIDKEAKAKVLEEKDLEYGQAIKIYQELIAAGFDAKRLTDKVKQLETLWSPPNAKTEFIRAREFIFQEWSKPLDVERLSASMEQAREALKAYKAVDNPLGPRKLSDGAIAHGMRLKGMLENLKAINADEALRIEAISAVIEALEKLNQDAEDYLNKAATKK